MPREVPRARRIAEQVQRVLSQLLLREVRDPRLKPMTVTHVKVSPDLTHMWVMYTLLSGDAHDELQQEILDEAAVYQLLFPGRGEHESVHAQPDWPSVHRELARVGVTLKLLHGEYVDKCRAEGSTAMGYDRFCKNYQQHVLISGAASRIGHKAGQSVEVDWSGPTMQLIDPVTGQQGGCSCSSGRCRSSRETQR